MTEKDSRLFDVRVVERNLRKGLISKQDVESLIGSLSDTSENVEESSVAQPGVVEDVQPETEPETESVAEPDPKD